MTEPTRLRTPIDILRTIPTLVEHSLVESLVVLPLNDDHGCAVLRMDLPRAELDPLRAEQYAASVVGYLCHLEDYQRVIVSIFTERRFDGPGMPPYRVVEEALHEALLRAGITPIVSLCRAGDGWGEYACDDPDCSGYGPRPLAEIEAPAPIPRIGLTTPRDILSLLLDSTDPARAALVHGRAESIRRDDTLAHRAFTAWEKRLESPRWTARELSRECAALQLALLEHPGTLVPWASATIFGAGSEHVLEEVWAGMLEAADTGVPMELFRAQTELPQVSRERLERAAFQARDLLTVTSQEATRNILTVLGILEWARGRASFAAECALFALDEDPNMWLAQLVLWFCDRGLVPPWFGVPPRTSAHKGLDAVA